MSSCTTELASHEFDSNTWRKNKAVDLSFNSDEDGLHDLVLEVRSIYGIPYQLVSLDFVLVKPNGDVVEISKDLSFNEEKLDCTGDFCDQKILILSDLQMKEGKYSLKISRYNTEVNLYGLMDFRLIQK